MSNSASILVSNSVSDSAHNVIIPAHSDAHRIVRNLVHSIVLILVRSLSVLSACQGFVLPILVL